MQRMWTPTSRYSNGKNIMETAVNDKLLQRQGKLEIINNCRMYIGAFFIGDLLATEKCIDKRYLQGKKKVKTHKGKFRNIRQPPDAA